MSFVQVLQKYPHAPPEEFPQLTSFLIYEVSLDFLVIPQKDSCIFELYLSNHLAFPLIFCIDGNEWSISYGGEFAKIINKIGNTYEIDEMINCDGNHPSELSFKIIRDESSQEPGFLTIKEDILPVIPEEILSLFPMLPGKTPQQPCSFCFVDLEVETI